MIVLCRVTNGTTVDQLEDSWGTIFRPNLFTYSYEVAFTMKVSDISPVLVRISTPSFQPISPPHSSKLGFSLYRICSLMCLLEQADQGWIPRRAARMTSAHCASSPVRIPVLSPRSKLNVQNSAILLRILPRLSSPLHASL